MLRTQFLQDQIPRLVEPFSQVYDILPLYTDMPARRVGFWLTALDQRLGSFDQDEVGFDTKTRCPGLKQGARLRIDHIIKHT